MGKTSNQLAGTRFEIFLEHLLKSQGYLEVLRNVEYHKSKYLFRQVDLTYIDLNNNKFERNIVEAKYSSNKIISYQLRSPVTKHQSNQKLIFNNIIDETIERKLFVGADNAFLVTNGAFDKKIVKEAKNKGIYLLTGNELKKIYNQSKPKISFDNIIKNINPYKHNLNKNIIYLN